ncbi:MAG: hypothetical protein KDK64_03750 [Chlamydiia bacterium]|nr:hypothetical protein [Chlamydiia bacterium]
MERPVNGGAVVAQQRPLIPFSFNDMRSELEIKVIEGFMCLVAINALFQAYHYKATQASLSGANVAVLFIAEESVKKGVVADNVQESRELTRDLQGTALDYKRMADEHRDLLGQTKIQLEQAQTLLSVEKREHVQHLREEHERLRLQNVALDERVAGLQRLEESLNARIKEMEDQAATLRTIGGHVRTSSEALARSMSARDVSVVKGGGNGNGTDFV